METETSKILVVEDTYEATQENTAQKLLIGLLLGFLTNFACILCAMIHGDIKLYLDVSASMIPVFIYASVRYGPGHRHRSW